MSDEQDIPNALLTDGQRAYLRGERDDLNESAERAMESRIQNRIATLTDDLNLLLENDEGVDVDAQLAQAVWSLNFNGAGIMADRFREMADQLDDIADSIDPE